MTTIQPPAPTVVPRAAHDHEAPVSGAGAVPSAWTTGGIRRTAGTVMDLFRTQTLKTPDTAAVQASGVVLTYRQLDDRSNQIAHHLAENGAQADTLIGVCLGRTADLLPALLGVWKAGAAYLPLDPDLPAQRLRQMLDDAQCPIVITTAPRTPALTAHQGTFVLMDQDGPAIDSHPSTNPQHHGQPGGLAYVIYTSGSTGTPKGVMIQHVSLVNYLQWTVETYAAHGSGGAPVFSSISFDLGIPNMFTPLLAGQTVYLLPEPFDIADLGRHLIANAPYSFIKMTPGHLDLLTFQLTAAQIHDLAGIVIAAGDSFTTNLAERWIELAGPGGTKIATEYGPTEITIGNSGQLIAVPPKTRLIPLGRPIRNTTMYVLADDLRPVPIGVAGEIYIGGVGVARGYLNRPDLTTERFLVDPYGPAGSRLYRSGDMGRWLPDGSLEFLGRVDNQVKIRGFRVELDEIRATLCRCPYVRDAVVTTGSASHEANRIVAYVTLERGHPLDGESLRADLALTLPEYMLPAAFVSIGNIPLTTNGKTDLRALPVLL